jgi:PST family polysaccharide transporter
VRDFRQDRFAKAEFAAIPVQIATAVVLALAGAGVWALAISQVLANCVSGALLLRAAPFRVGLGFRLDIARPMLAYGLPLALTSLVEYSLLNADYLIISRALDPAAVGIYLLAFNVSTWPLSIITDAVRRVSIAGFAKLEGDTDSLRRNFSRAFAALLSVAFPFLVALGVLALPLITVLYGEDWIESASILPYLVVLTGARMAIGFVFDLLVGVGRTRTTLALKCAWLAAVIVALEIGVRADGLRGAAIGHGIVATLVAMPLFLLAASRAGADIPDVARRLARPAIGAVVATAAGVVVRDGLERNVVILVLGGGAVLGTYSLVALRRKDLARVEVRLRRWRTRAPTPLDV